MKKISVNAFDYGKLHEIPNILPLHMIWQLSEWRARFANIGITHLKPVFIGVRVTRSLVLFLCFVDRCLSFCPFSCDHCVVCPS